jgi:hypothetical protein
LTFLAVVQLALLMAPRRRWWIAGETAVFRELSVQSGRHSSLVGVCVAAKTLKTCRVTFETVVASGCTVPATGTGTGAVAARCDSRYLAGDFSSDTGA